jgi:hypothetical protein
MGKHVTIRSKAPPYSGKINRNEEISKIVFKRVWKNFGSIGSGSVAEGSLPRLTIHEKASFYLRRVPL